MISFDFTHTDENGAADTFANDSRDLFVWESTDKAGRAFLETFADGRPRMVDLYKLAWITARRLELIDRKLALDDYAHQYRLEVDSDEATEADPTRAAQSPTG